MGDTERAGRNIPVPEDASNTFHGRDVFAKTAASIDLGHFETIGPKIEEIEEYELYLNGREGVVVRIDRFGNVITNLPNEGKAAYSVKIEDRNYKMNFHPNYDAAKDNELFLIEGSCGTLEISLKNGNANDKLHIETGRRIEIS